MALRKQNKGILVRVTEDERSMFQKLTEENGQTVTGVLRKCIRDYNLKYE